MKKLWNGINFALALAMLFAAYSFLNREMPLVALAIIAGPIFCQFAIKTVVKFDE